MRTSQKSTERVCLGYGRKSVVRNTSDTITIERQRAAIEELAARRLERLEWFEDAEGHRSGRFERTRPAFMSLLSRIENDPSVKSVIVYRIDRAGRSVIVNDRLIKLCQAKGIVFISIVDGIDTSSGLNAGEILRIQALSMASEYQANRASDDMRDAVQKFKRAGVAWGYTAFGLERVGQGYDARLAPTGDAQIVDALLSHFVTSPSYAETARAMNERGYRFRNRRGAERFEYTPKVPDMSLCRAVVDFWLNMPLPPPGDAKIRACPRFKILRNRAILLALISSGARISEVMSLRLSQFASNEDSAWICGKRKLWRYIFFAPGACDAIQEYIVERNRLFPDERDHLWLSSTRGGQLTINAVSAMLTHTLIALGVPRGAISPHSYRHYVATEMLHLGFSIHQIQKYLGHTTATTTSKVYAHVLDEDRRRAVQNYHQAALQFNKRRPAPPRPFVSDPPPPAPPPPPSPVSYVYLPAAWEMSVSERV